MGGDAAVDGGREGWMHELLLVALLPMCDLLRKEQLPGVVTTVL